MAKSNRLPEIAKVLDEPLDTLIPRTLKEEGSEFKAAIRLGVFPNTIRNWLKKNNYRRVGDEWICEGHQLAN